jgi:transcriptional antiterminator
MDKFVLSKKEISIMLELARIKNGEITQSEAAKLLKMSSRQIRRTLKKYGLEGPYSLH